jgi:hypothetical protein
MIFFERRSFLIRVSKAKLFDKEKSVESLHTNEQQPLSEDILTSDAIAVMMKEYDALRAEVLTRIQLMHQVTSLALIVPGTIFAFGFQTQNATLILLYPILALVLALIWSQCDRRSREIGYYIHTRIESRLKDVMGWEHFMDSTRTAHKLFDLDALWAAAGVFAGTEVLAILVGIPISTRFGTLIPLYFLLSTAILSVLLTVIRLFVPYNHRERIHRYSHALSK